jgi:hypothetical protein
VASSYLSVWLMMFMVFVDDDLLIRILVYGLVLSVRETL